MLGVALWEENVWGKYTVKGKTHNSIDVCIGLGVQVHNSLKVATQVDRVVNKTYGLPAFIGQGIEYRGQHVMI